MPGLNDYQVPRDSEWEYTKTTPYTNRHEMLTGSQLDGRAYPAGRRLHVQQLDEQQRSCSRRSAGARRRARQAECADRFPDRNGGGNGSWNSSHGTTGCSQTALNRTHGVGMFYCFATN